MVARSVWCRPAASRGPPASTAKLRSSRRASSAGVIAGTRAARPPTGPRSRSGLA